MNDSPITRGVRFDKGRTRQVVEALHRDGFFHIPEVLSAVEVAALRTRADELLDDPMLCERENPELGDTRYVQCMRHCESGEELPFILRNTIELDGIFRDMLVREPILGLAEAVVGEDCKFCGQNVLRNLPGLAIEKWHVDGTVHFPLPQEIERFDARIRLPVLWLTVQMALSDIDTVEQGPTQYVPGSHMSGRRPPTGVEEPEFEGRGPVSILCQAGDIYLQDPMCWHRGAPNRSGRTRYILQSQYAVKWAYTRFGLYNRVPVPEEDLRVADERLLQVLGRPRP